MTDIVKVRKRRAHKKSRNGCSNCKLRGVKCDEAMPDCNRCRSFGVACDYRRAASSLEPSISGTMSFEHAHQPASSPETPIMGSSIFQHEAAGVLPGWDHRLTSRDIQMLYLYQTQSITTVGNRAQRSIVKNGFLRLAYSYPLIMHQLIAITLMHENYITGNDNPLKFKDLSYHEHQTTVLYNRALTELSIPNKQETIYAATLLMEVICLGLVDAKTPKDAWPLASNPPYDLVWLKVAIGKQTIMKYVDLSRSGGTFIDFARSGMARITTPLDPSALVQLPSQLLTFCELVEDPLSANEDNPFFLQATILANLLPLDSTTDNIVIFFSFIYHISPTFGNLLEAKDPRALLLLLYWYTKLSHSACWWYKRRAIVEGPAICFYLSMHYPRHSVIQELLLWPRALFGIYTEAQLSRDCIAQKQTVEQLE